MPHPDIGNSRKHLEIDLLSSPKRTQKWIPLFLRRRSQWRVFSGSWASESPNKVTYLRDPRVKTGENIALIGSPDWNEFTFRVKFKLLTESLMPPQGGTVLYFLFKNMKNHYSFHFCLPKQKIEFVKRFLGTWSIMAAQDYDLEIQRDYWIRISTDSGRHQCQVDGMNLITIHDRDISKGCVGIGVKYCNVEFSHLSISTSQIG